MPFDDTWKEREFLGAMIKGVTQFPEFVRYRWVLRYLSYLPTRLMLGVLHWFDDWISGGQGRHFVESTCKPTLSRREAHTGGHTWRVWRYQQCAEVGMFDGAEDPNGLLYRTRQEICNECRTLFGEAPFCDADPSWNPRAKLESLTVPVVWVSGGQDPWLGAGLEVGRHPRLGRHFHVPNGGHCHDRHDPNLAQQAIAQMLKWAVPSSATK